MPLSDIKCRTAKPKPSPTSSPMERGCSCLLPQRAGSCGGLIIALVASDTDPGAARKAEKQAQTRLTENTFTELKRIP